MKFFIVLFFALGLLCGGQTASTGSVGPIGSAIVSAGNTAASASKCAITCTGVPELMQHLMRGQLSGDINLTNDVLNALENLLGFKLPNISQLVSGVLAGDVGKIIDVKPLITELEKILADVTAGTIHTLDDVIKAINKALGSELKLLGGALGSLQIGAPQLQKFIAYVKSLPSGSTIAQLIPGIIILTRGAMTGAVDEIGRLGLPLAIPLLHRGIETIGSILDKFTGAPGSATGIVPSKAGGATGIANIK